MTRCFECNHSTGHYADCVLVRPSSLHIPPVTTQNHGSLIENEIGIRPMFIVIGHYSDGSGISDSALVFTERVYAERFIARCQAVGGSTAMSLKIIPAEMPE